MAKPHSSSLFPGQLPQHGFKLHPFQRRRSWLPKFALHTAEQSVPPVRQRQPSTPPGAETPTLRSRRDSQCRGNCPGSCSAIKKRASSLHPIQQSAPTNPGENSAQRRPPTAFPPARAAPAMPPLLPPYGELPCIPLPAGGPPPSGWALSHRPGSQLAHPAAHLRSISPVGLPRSPITGSTNTTVSSFRKSAINWRSKSICSVDPKKPL